VNWFPQFKRDLYKYQEGNGIQLLQAPKDKDPYLASGYWNSIRLLSQEYFDDGFNIPTRLLEATYLSLRYDFQAHPTEFYKFTLHSPRIRKEDYSVPRYQKICHLRSISNHVATSYILNRLPTNIFFPEQETAIPWHVLLKDIPVATRLTTEPTGQPYTSRPKRAKLHGIPAGTINHHYTEASDLTKYRVKI
jgi:hypothetical protein